MSEEMAPSWRSLASAASRSIKGYIAQQREIKQGYPAARGQQNLGADSQTKKQSWSQWAGQKLRRGSQGEYDNSGDRLALFPGWAARRYREPPRGADDGTHTIRASSGLQAKVTRMLKKRPSISMYSSRAMRTNSLASASTRVQGGPSCV